MTEVEEAAAAPRAAAGMAPAYNPIFERFVNVDQPDIERLPGMVAYCLYKIAKREWTTQFFDRNGRKPSEGELAEYIATWTTSRLEGAQKEADAVVLSFASDTVDANAGRIREEALRGTFWKSVGTSMFAALLYTVLLLAAIIVAQTAGVDVLSIFQAVNK